MSDTSTKCRTLAERERNPLEYHCLNITNNRLFNGTISKSCPFLPRIKRIRFFQLVTQIK